MRFLLIIGLILFFISACASNSSRPRSGFSKKPGATQKTTKDFSRKRNANPQASRQASTISTQNSRAAYPSDFQDNKNLLPTIVNAKDRSLMVLVNSGANRVSLLNLPKGTLRPGKQGSGAINPPAFYMDQLEVTVKQYKIFDGKYDEKPFTDGKECPDCPAMAIDWMSANRYCLWAGKRLPTEAEWVAAASGESGNLWPWGNQFSPEKANLWGNEDGSLLAAPVGSFSQGASPYGLLDMTGNVWEWVSTPYAVPKRGADTTTLRVIKGGGWTSDKHSARISFRNVVHPAMKNPTIGFRCAKSI